MSELMRLARTAANGGQADGSATDTATPNGKKDKMPAPHGGCATCLYFIARSGSAAVGACARYNVETLGSHTAGCQDGFMPKGMLEARHRKVADVLRANQALKYAYDVQGASPKGLPSDPVSVVLGLRHSTGTIVTGELTVAAERWDMAAFIAYWDAQWRPS